MPSASTSAGKRFAYGYGRIGVLQQYFLSQSDIDRLLGSHDDKELLRTLSELNLARGTDPSLDPREMTVRLERTLEREVVSMAGDGASDAFGILWLHNDGSLLAYLLKKHYGLTSDISTVPAAGAHAYDPAALRELVEHGRALAELPKSLVSFVTEMRSLENPSPQLIDDRVAQYVAGEQLRLAKRSGSSLILRYVKHHIDLKNIRTARRLRPEDSSENHLMPGGRIPAADISADPKKLAQLIRSSHLPSELADFLDDTDEASLALERGLARAIARDIAAMRDKVLGIDPVFAYAAVMLSQIRVLRTLVIGKSMKLSSAEIKQLLPPFLSASPFAS